MARIEAIGLKFACKGDESISGSFSLRLLSGTSSEPRKRIGKIDRGQMGAKRVRARRGQSCQGARRGLETKAAVVLAKAPLRLSDRLLSRPVADFHFHQPHS